MECRVITNCASYLEVALVSPGSDVVHFLNREGFITQEVCDDVLNPRSMLTERQKAGQLVAGIRKAVLLSPRHYSTLLSYFRADRARYGGIVDILDREYRKQQLTGITVPTNAVRNGAFSRYGEYLKKYYGNHLVKPDDKLSIAPCSEFIKLALILKRRVWYLSDSMDVKASIDMDALLVPNGQSIVVEGPPGIGKSTLCCELCRSWDSLTSLQGYKLVLLVELRERRVQEATTLKEILDHQDPKLCKAVVSELNKCVGEGVLLIFDGFDEIPPHVVKDKSRLIMRLISGKCLPGAKRLVTSRPSAFQLEEYFPHHGTYVEILGFTDEYKVKFAEMAFKSDPEMLARFKRFVFSNPIIAALMDIPMNCAIVAKVFRDISKSRIPNTVTQLYTILILVLIRRYMIEIGKWDKYSNLSSSIEALPQEVTADLKRVSELAYRGLFEKGLQLVFAEDNVGAGFQHLGLLNETKEMYLYLGTRTSYSFAHHSIQEFLAAWHVSCHPDSIGNIVSQIIGYYDTSIENLSVFGQFLAGLIGCENFGFTKGYFVSSFKLRCLYEEQNLSGTSEAYLRTPSSTFLATPLDMYVFGYILIHAPVEWTVTVSTSFDMLASSLADHARPNSKIQGSITDLNLRHYVNKDSSAVSNLEGLPAETLQVITGITVGVANDSIPVLVKDIATLCNLQSINLDVVVPCPKDHELYRALQNASKLKRLDLTFHDMSEQGIQELSKTISNSHCLNRFVVMKRFSHNALPMEDNFCKLTNAALLCSTLTQLHLSLPVHTFNTEVSIPNISLSISLKYHTLTVRLFDFMFCIADVCKATSVSSFKLDIYLPIYYAIITNIPPWVYCKFISILNNSLHCNPSLKGIGVSRELSPICRIPIGLLSSALRTPVQKLRRSKSLCDLTTVKCIERIKWKIVYHHQSCPDLLEMQSVHSMHPSLHKFIGRYNKLNSYYYDGDKRAKVRAQLLLK